MLFRSSMVAALVKDIDIISDLSSEAQESLLSNSNEEELARCATILHWCFTLALLGGSFGAISSVKDAIL